MKVASILEYSLVFKTPTPSQGRNSEALVSPKTLGEGRVFIHFKL